ncbi:hypothetical protein LshimejAT787_1900030 [Lyophyllum shimeji]|uniref:Uncharacterized protein n=1 Tax=Lyophyllum shimeji TaxID=47721 RepID=A0A9P3PXN5_LYOSH|nr:hypothetical protein LshimejAT787_1900030 [Lyophyllum shimeji]
MTMGKSNELLSYQDARRARPRCCVYGFPLDDAALVSIGEKLHPIPSDLTGEEHLAAGVAQSEMVHEHLLSACEAVWPWDRLAPVIGYTKGKYYSVIAVAASKRPNDELIPQGEDMEKLKKIMADNGFKDEPRWFVMG